jgi:hypothetical protein
MVGMGKHGNPHLNYHLGDRDADRRIRLTWIIDKCGRFRGCDMDWTGTG